MTPLNLQVAGCDDRFKVDSFSMNQCLDPLLHVWDVTVDHDMPVAVEALVEHRRHYWVRTVDGVVIAMGEAMIGWDAVPEGERLHISIHGDAFPEEDAEALEARRKRRSALGSTTP